jgi:dCTP deaminase
MILSDRSIRDMLDSGDLVIDPPPADQCIQPASVDLLLGQEFMSPYENHFFMVDSGYYSVIPGECILATTLERVEIPDNMVARVEGKSSFGRRFLQIHSTAGFIDPGFHGQITLELTNLSKTTVCVEVGQPIAQISFEWLDRAVERPYGSDGLNSHYQDQEGVTGSGYPW